MTFILRLAARLLTIYLALLLSAIAFGKISPDDILAFSSQREAEYGSQIYVMDVQRVLTKQISYARGKRESSTIAAWSPDGKELAYVTDLEGGSDPSGIFIRNLFGGEKQVFTGYRGVFFLSWSPDGSKIALESSNAQDFAGITILNRAGGDTYHLPVSGVTYPYWTPQQQIVFVGVSSTGDTNRQIFMLDRDASRSHALTNDHLLKIEELALSPDGQQIVFSAYNPDASTASIDLYIVDVNDGHARQLTGKIQGGSVNVSPSWSPDGKQIAYATNQDGDFDIFVMNADGSQQHPITFDNITDDRPSWSPDGKQILFEQSGNLGSASLYLVDADGQNLRFLAANSRNASWKP